MPYARRILDSPKCATDVTPLVTKYAWRILICATHSLSMAHLEDAPLMGKLCVAHINMRHAYFVTNGVTSVTHFGESNMRHA